MYELIIFDIDSTMIDTTKRKKESPATCARTRQGPTDEEVARVSGVPTPGDGDTHSRISKSRAGDISTCSENTGKRPSFDGTRLLQELDKQGARCGIVTSRNRKKWRMTLPSETDEVFQVRRRRGHRLRPKPSCAKIMEIGTGRTESFT